MSQYRLLPDAPLTHPVTMLYDLWQSAQRSPCGVVRGGDYQGYSPDVSATTRPQAGRLT